MRRVTHCRGQTRLACRACSCAGSSCEISICLGAMKTMGIVSAYIGVVSLPEGQLWAQLCKISCSSALLIHVCCQSPQQASLLALGLSCSQPVHKHNIICWEDHVQHCIPSCVL